RVVRCTAGESRCGELFHQGGVRISRPHARRSGEGGSGFVRNDGHDLGLVGYSAEKAGAIEVAAGVDGQIMPPVMGAAAFLMAEYVGVSYAEICRNAALPAAISYIALFYIVHLEACKAGIKGLPPRPGTSPLGRLAGIVMTLAALVIFANVVYYGLGWIKDLF